MRPGSTPATTIRPRTLAFLAEALIATAAIEAARHLGVFARLEAGSVDVSTVARECAIGERETILLLEALASIELVRGDGSGGFQSNLPHPYRSSGLTPSWQSLCDVLRNERPLVDCDERSGSEAYYPDMVPVLSGLFASAAERAADRLAAPGLRVLDVGAGAIPWSAAIARRNPDSHFTAVDLPSVIPATRQAVATAGLESQFLCLAGDMFSLNWRSGSFDMVIAGNVCHLFGEAMNSLLLGRLYAALRPGGRLAIIDVLPNESDYPARSVALYALGLLMRTSSGQVYPVTTYVRWLREAGFEKMERADLSDVPPACLITARRPYEDCH